MGERSAVQEVSIPPNCDLNVLNQRTEMLIGPPNHVVVVLVVCAIMGSFIPGLFMLMRQEFSVGGEARNGIRGRENRIPRPSMVGDTTTAVYDRSSQVLKSSFC